MHTNTHEYMIHTHTHTHTHICICIYLCRCTYRALRRRKGAMHVVIITDFNAVLSGLLALRRCKWPAIATRAQRSSDFQLMRSDTVLHL